MTLIIIAIIIIKIIIIIIIRVIIITYLDNNYNITEAIFNFFNSVYID